MRTIQNRGARRVLTTLAIVASLAGMHYYPQHHTEYHGTTNCATVADNQVGSAPGPAWNAAYDACVSSEKFMGNR